MKWSGIILLFLMCAFGSVLFPFAAAAKTDRSYAIVVSDDAAEPEVYAAETLSYYLSALDGGDYPILRDGQPFDGFAFCIGTTSFYDTSDITGKAADSYCIAPFRSGVAIYGSGSRGTVNGVYAFLEKFCGYRCYTGEAGMVSVSGRMTLPEKKVEYEPFFEFRDTDWRSGWYPVYSLANKLNGQSHQAVTREQGGGIYYLGSANHTLSTLFCSADKYFAGHPEYFALRDGERVPDQLCLTNDTVYHIVLEEVQSLLREYHDPGADLQIISLSQADNPNYCECDRCKALDSANGSQAGTMITFVNRIARAVKAAGYDNVVLDTFAYTYTRKAPTAVVPEENVIVRLCTLECCFSHPLDDAGCPENVKLMRDLGEWSEICDHLYIWDYTTNYACTLGIFPDFHVLQRNMQCFYEHGIRGVYEEGNYYIHQCDTEFGDLRTYLIAKLLEDPYCDYEAEMLDFCKYYYGGGGEYIRKAIDEITAGTKDHVSIYSPMTKTFAIDEKEAEDIDRLWSRAENAAGGQDALAAIERSKLSWRYVKAALGVREFRGTLEESKDEREALYHDMIAHGVGMIDEWTAIAQDFAEYENIPVEEWEKAGRYYYLQYDMNGGTGGPPNQWCNTGENWIPEKIPTRKGYRFLGWATEKDAAAAEYFPGGSIALASDLSLYAVWEEAPEWGPEETQQEIWAPFGFCDLYIGGEKADDQNVERLQDWNGIFLREEGRIRYDAVRRTLYLKDVDIIPPKDTENDGTAIAYNSRDNIPLTIEVEGTCRLESRDSGQDSLMVLASWGNLNIRLAQGSVLELEASPGRGTYTNIGIYMDSDSALTVSGPGTLRVTGGDARPVGGGSFALYTQGDIIFEKDCTVSILSDTASAISEGCYLESGDLTLKDGSQIEIKGGESVMSYGIQFAGDGIHPFYAENWTGHMTVSGSAGAVRYEEGTDARIQKDPKTMRWTGYTADGGEERATLLDKKIYRCEALQKFTKLLLEGSEQ